jgi:hypothetical protein
MTNTIKAAGLGLILLALAAPAGAQQKNTGNMHGCSSGDLQGAGESQCLDQNSTNQSGINVGWYVRCEADGTHSCCSVTDPGNGKSYTNCEVIGAIATHVPTNVSRVPLKNAKP